MNWHKKVYWFVGMFCIFIQIGIFPVKSWADQFQWVEPGTVQRTVEPVVVQGEALPEFLNISIDQIFMFAYRYDAVNDTGSWEAIPFQIDEVVETGSQPDYFSDRDGVFDNDDELLFMVKDLGAKVPDGYWIDNPESRLFSRCELEVIDGVDPTKKAWGYLFKSSSSIPKSPVDYVGLESVSKEIHSLYYQVGFYLAKGIPWKFAITSEGGGTNVDILDRLKLHVKISTSLPGYGEIYVSEEDILAQGDPQIVDGPVRVFRSALLQFRKTLLGQTFTSDFSFPIFFYPYHMSIAADSIDLDLGGGISGITVKLKLVRYSFDFNTNAKYMEFTNMRNRERNIIIDGEFDSMDHTIDPSPPDLNWALMSGDPGSVLMINYVPRLGSEQWFYYFDKKEGGSWWIDGTPDTGSKGCYGDSGILFKGDDIKGTFKFITSTYFLPANRPYEIGDSLIQIVESPVTVHPQIQSFDITPPAAIADLSIEDSDVTDLTMLVSWYAVGDDGNQGRAFKYDLRYSKYYPPSWYMDYWWEHGTTPVQNMPEPQEPGTVQSVVIGNLEPNTKYYVVMKVLDEAGNQSQYSTTAIATTLDVELVAFYAQVFDRHVVLRWSTASETNNLGFEIQRRTKDGEYQAIGFVKGNGTTSTISQYNYVDENLAAPKYYYRLKQIDTNGQVHFHSEIVVQTRLPQNFVLYQNYPNPFSMSDVHGLGQQDSRTTIEFYLPEATNVRVTIFNFLGQEVSTLINEPMPIGFHSCRWDGRDSQQRGTPAGIYFYRIHTDTWTAIRKLLLLR